MAYGSSAFGSSPYSASSGAEAISFEAQSLGPLLKHGSHTGLQNQITDANTVGALLKFATATSEVVWNPVPASGYAEPLLPLLKFGTAEMALDPLAEPIGPLLKFARAVAELNKKSGDAGSVGTLLKYGTHSASLVIYTDAAGIGPLLKWGSASSSQAMAGEATSISPLLHFGTPEREAQRAALSGVFVRDTTQPVYVRN